MVRSLCASLIQFFSTTMMSSGSHRGRLLRPPRPGTRIAGHFCSRAETNAVGGRHFCASINTGG